MLAAIGLAKLATVLGSWFAVASAITAILYYRDKKAAAHHKPRVAESTLLTWSVIGGWPGAIWIGRVIRHKTKKTGYRIKFAFAIMINIAIAVAILYFTWKRQ